MGFWPVVLNVLKNSDVVLLLMDARMPEMTQNKELIAKVDAMGEKRIIFIFNKCDLVSKNSINRLKKENPNAYFISGIRKTGIRDLIDHLQNLADNFIRPSLRVGIVGYPNVGKSTLINLLAPEAHAKVSNISGTTKKTQWIRVGNIRIMDSPGVIPHSDRHVEMGITAAKDPQRLKDPEKVAFKLIEYLDGNKKGVLQKFYGVRGEGALELFEEIGKKRGFLVKGGQIDEHRTAIKILEDWQRGEIKV